MAPRQCAVEIQGRFLAGAEAEVLAWVTSEAESLWDESRALGYHEPMQGDLGRRRCRWQLAEACHPPHP
jgi:hypothetical protein